MHRSNEFNKQNGRQPLLKTAENLISTSSNKGNNVCRDYVWGKCYKYGQCKFRHECDVETMISIIQFCHDYQNPTGCIRPNCTYLHSTSEEEKLFRETGQLPAELAKRHAFMNATVASMSRQYPEDSYLNKPPPPPPETQPPPPPPPAGTTMFHNVPRWFPPPPPPPPPPPREPSPPAHVYSGPPKVAPVYIPQQPPPQMPRIDTSRPPPPLPGSLHVKNGAIKRTLTDASEAGPSKSRRSPKRDSGTCENCTQWEIRNLLLETKLKKKLAEKACFVLEYEEKRNEINNIGEMIMKYVEGTSFQMNSTLSYTSDIREIFLNCLNSTHNDSFNSVLNNLSPRNEQNDFLRALISNYISEVPEVAPDTSQNQFLRRVADILKDSDLSASSSQGTNSVINELERLLNTDFGGNTSEPAAGAIQNVPAPSMYSFPSTSGLGQGVAHVPPPPLVQYQQPFRPTENNVYTYPFATSHNSGVGENPPPRPLQPSSTISSLAPGVLQPPFNGQTNNYGHYNMMGRPPPSQ